MLNTLARDFLGLHGHISATMASLTRVQVALAGLGAMTIGAGLLKGTADLVHAGEDLIHQQARLQAALGDTALAHDEVAEATRRAWAASRDVRGTTVESNLHAITDLRTVFGDLEHAIDLMPRFQAFAQVLADVGGKVSEAGGGAAFLAARAVEMRGELIGANGQVDPERMMNALDELTRVEVKTGGRVDPRQFLQFVQMARGAGMTLSEESLYTSMPALIIAMGGMRAGTGLQTAWKEIVGGTMAQAAANELLNLGLTDATVDRHGKTIGDKTAVRNQEKFAEDPIAWVAGTLLPALQAHGIVDPEGIQKEIGRIFSNRTSAGFIGEIARNLASFQKDQRQIQEGGDVGIGLFEREDVAQKVRDMEAAFHNFFVALGSPLVHPAMVVMDNITTVVNYMAKVAAEHPDGVRVVGEVIAGLGAFLVTAGGIAIAGTVLSFLMAGSAASALAVTTGALAALAAALMAADWGKLWDNLLEPLRYLGMVARDPTKLAPGGYRAPDGVPMWWQAPTDTDGDHAGRRRIPAEPPNPLSLDGNYDNPYRRESAPAPAATAPSPINISVYLDGDKIAPAMIRRAVQWADGPLAGTGGFDGRRNMATQT